MKVFDLPQQNILMPEMDGFEVCRRLKHDSETSHTPVIFLVWRKQFSLALNKTLLTGFDSGVDYISATVHLLCSNEEIKC